MDLFMFKMKFSPSLQEGLSFLHSTATGREAWGSSCSCAQSCRPEMRNTRPLFISCSEIPYVCSPELIHKFHPLFHQLLLSTDNINLKRWKDKKTNWRQLVKPGCPQCGLPSAAWPSCSPWSRTVALSQCSPEEANVYLFSISFMIYSLSFSWFDLSSGQLTPTQGTLLPLGSNIPTRPSYLSQPFSNGFQSQKQM